MPHHRHRRIEHALKMPPERAGSGKGSRHIMRLKKLIAVSLALCLNASAQGNPLNVFLKDLSSFSADFEQNLINDRGEVLETTRGRVQLRRPGMFLWAYQEPYVQKIISDGTTLWIFDADLAQVTISDALMMAGDAPALIFNDQFPIAERYVVVELDDEDDMAWIELTPRDVNAQYRALRLGFLNDDLKGMILFDSLGQRTRLSFSNTNRNPALDRDVFEFSPPEGTDVIDSREDTGRQ